MSMLISNSQDILFLVLAFCALWLTAFLVWFLYYAVQSVRQIYNSIHQIKEKIEASFSYLTLIVSGVRKMIDLLGSNKETKRRRS